MEHVKIPSVFIDRKPLNFKGDVVRVDDFEGGRLATSHLIKYGHKDIAFFGDYLRIQPTKLRLNGYKKALVDANIKLNHKFVHVDMDDETKAESVMDKILESKVQPTALFASKSELSAGILRALHSKKRTDIAMISFDDFRFADTLLPAVSVLNHSSRDLARVAITRLFRKLDWNRISCSRGYFAFKK
jgi:LacI family transcriptional regulator